MVKTMVCIVSIWFSPYLLDGPQGLLEEVQVELLESGSRQGLGEV